MTATSASPEKAEMTLRERWKKATKPPRRLTFTRAGKFFMMLTIAVGLGERDQEDENKPTQIRQRVAVIIADNKQKDNDSYCEEIYIIRSSLDVVSVSLDRYERSEGAGFQMHIVTGSRFIEASDESWDFDDGLADRSVLENGDAPN